MASHSCCIFIRLKKIYRGVCSEARRHSSLRSSEKNKMLVLCLAAVFAISTSVAERVCPEGFDYISETDQCLKLNTVKATWSNARKACSKIAVGGQLLAITTSAKQEAIKKYLEPKFANTKDCYWTGYESAKNVVWITGQTQAPCRCDTPYVWKYNGGSEVPFTFTKWTPGQPDCYNKGEQCIHLAQSRSYDWNDIPCTASICSVCEI